MSSSSLEEKSDNSGVISIGNYVVLNRKGFNKLHMLTDNLVVFMGKDKVDLRAIIGKPFWTSFKMVKKKDKKREYELCVCERSEIIEIEEQLKVTASGEDNRNIWDDGNSQKLSTEEIVELRDSGLSADKIVGHLIENSKTFHNKTEYSQQKYLKKKGSKYFEFMIIKKPTFRLLCDVMFTKDQSKILGLRIDSMSQIFTSVNLQPDGKYIVYENGLQGLVAAGVLNYLGDGGKLIHVNIGKHPQQHAILAMNFSENQRSRMQTVKLSTLIRKLNCSTSVQPISSAIDKEKEVDPTVSEFAPLEAKDKKIDNSDEQETCETMVENGVKNEEEVINVLKRKKSDSDNETLEVKKPRWEEDAESVAALLKSRTCDGLIVVCKEHPGSIVKKFLSYLAPSRSFVVFSFYREPLVELYTELKERHDVINMRLTETWMRNYQVLPDRTHPDVMMSGNSGFLLTGILVDNK
ncbi:hypothetical protein LSTR_LSTR002359 [Laodelphax striatellus]|uniref:tRNA (adenine(58)-N(1))-methyltransferase non-catalytic subunit TRM6 n=1 Tax=Laodelphax striatellus TaxID=195883 RepID=A0A482X2X0_LAOST|nr:hypothetical protein LSTR_LSTR002359 [Laodelphax striatellus]